MRRWLISLTLAFAALSTLTAESGIRKDELRCEEAKKHIADCCGTVYADYLDCHYYEGGCDSSPTYPALSLEQSECISSSSCEDLQQLGCGTVEDACR